MKCLNVWSARASWFFSFHVVDGRVDLFVLENMWEPKELKIIL